MKLIDLSRKSAPASGLSGALAKARTALAGPEAKAQEAAIQRLGRILDNRFTLLQNAPYFPAGSLPVLLLAGPPGLWLLHASEARGLFRATGPAWESDAGQGEFRPARPNLIEEMRRLLPVVQTVLQGLEGAPVPEPVLLFLNSGAHIDLQRPEVRIVPADALDRFSASLLKAAPVVEVDLVRAIVERLQNPSGEEALPPEVAFAHLDGSPLPQAPAAPSRLEQLGSREPEVIRRIDRRTNFSRRQWLIVGGLIAVNILILLIAILVALLTT